MSWIGYLFTKSWQQAKARQTYACTEQLECMLSGMHVQHKRRMSGHVPRFREEIFGMMLKRMDSYLSLFLPFEIVCKSAF